MSCVFCEILAGNIPSMKVYEDEYTFAFMDIAKDVDGHILVIPKKHFKNVLDCDEETLRHVIATVKKVANHLVQDCGYEGVNILNASDECAGQTVPHLHFHIVPRKNGDGIDGWPHYPGASHEIAEIWEVVKMTS